MIFILISVLVTEGMNENNNSLIVFLNTKALSELSDIFGSINC